MDLLVDGDADMTFTMTIEDGRVFKAQGKPVDLHKLVEAAVANEPSWQKIEILIEKVKDANSI